jgi:microcin C transport system substrate-binding protein
MKFSTGKIVVFLALLTGVTLLPACRNKKSATESKNFNHPDCLKTSLWKKNVETPPGADPSVPDSLGGNGFEKIAESMGFLTYTPIEDEKKYFGDPRATTGGEFNVIMGQFPATLRPEGENSNSVYNTMIKGAVYEALLAQHPLDNRDIPALASHWRISPDKMTYTFRIDPNARFSDGNPVTSEDVVASWKLLMDEGLNEPSNLIVYGKYEQPVALSKYLVQVKSKVLNFRNFLYISRAMLIMSAKEIGGLTGKEFLDKYQYNMPVGSGEYIVLTKDVKEGVKITLTRRDDYWAKNTELAKYAGNFDKYNYQIVADNPSLEYEKFKNGDADIFRFNMMTTEKWVKDTEYEALKNGWIKRARVFTDGPMGTAGYAFNMRKPPFDDIRLRKAMAHLLPRKQIIEKLLYNEYEPYDTHYPNTEWANLNNSATEYNPELASKLLDEAGWSQRNPEGIRTKGGKPLSFTLAIQKSTERFVTPYQQELKKAGIDMQLKFEDWATTIRNIDERNFNVFSFGYSGLSTPNPETSLLSSLADKNNNNNIQGVKNARIDQLCKIYDTTFDTRQQIKIIHEIDSITHSMVFDIMQWNPKGIRIVYWDKFGMPEYILPRTGSLSYIESYPMGLWWYDVEKAKKLEEARKSKKPIEGSTDIRVVRFWKDIKKSS